MILKTSEKWAKKLLTDDVVILDPDGWDRENFQYSFFEELITQEEFERRVRFSTCILSKLNMNTKCIRANDLFPTLNQKLFDSSLEEHYQSTAPCSNVSHLLCPRALQTRDISVQSVDRHLTALTKKQRLRLLALDAPELLAVASDARQKEVVVELREVITPLKAFLATTTMASLYGTLSENAEDGTKVSTNLIEREQAFVEYL